MTTILAFKFIGPETPKVAKFNSKRAAINNANDWFLPANAEELAAQNVLAPTAEMVKLYNQLAETPVKKFTDRATAANRLWAIVNEKVTTMDENKIPDNITEKFQQSTAAEQEAINKKAAEKAEKKAAAEKLAEERKATREAKAAEKAEAKAKREAERAEKKAAKEAAKGDKTRRSRVSGHTLFATVAKDGEGTVKNPRREGSHGYRSLQIILDAGDAGITTEDYVKAGGRMNDLNWDIDHGNVKSVAPEAAAE